MERRRQLAWPIRRRRAHQAHEDAADAGTELSDDIVKLGKQHLTNSADTVPPAEIQYLTSEKDYVWGKPVVLTT
jgi:hypothetical protein